MIRALGILGLLMLGSAFATTGAWRIALILWGASVLAGAVVVDREEKRYAALDDEERRR